MEKLIVVGMRFQAPEAVQFVEKAVKINGGSIVTLQREANVDGYSGYAVRVLNALGHSVGYVRNSDLPELFKQVVVTGLKYKVRKCCANYWILDKVEQRGNMLVHNEDFEKSSWDTKATSTIDSITKAEWQKTCSEKYTISSDPKANPCGEIELPKNTVKDENKMFNTNSMRDSFFREVKNVAIDIQSGKFGVVTTDGISVYDAANGGVSVNPITDFGVKVPAFAMRVAITDLKAGDIIVGGSEPSFFVELLKEGGYVVTTMSGERRTVGSVTNMFFGKNTVLAVKNMFGEGVNPMMMALMMGEDKKGEGFDMKTFALMSMMGQNAGNGGMDSNMLMMMMMMGK